MGKGILLFILIVINIFSIQAQNSPEELGEKIFNLFKNESYSFREVVPTTDQLIDKVETVNPELIKNRLDEYRKDYSDKLKGFNEKCETILGNGAALGIVWQDIELDSIKPYKKKIGLKYEDKTLSVEITKLCIYFSSNHQEYQLILDAVLDFDGQFLVSDDAIVLNAID